MHLIMMMATHLTDKCFPWGQSWSSQVVLSTCGKIIIMVETGNIILLVMIQFWTTINQIVKSARWSEVQRLSIKMSGELVLKMVPRDMDQHHISAGVSRNLSTVNLKMVMR